MIDRLDGIAARYGLGELAANRLSRLAELLASESTAPTTIRAPTRILNDHIADSLVALECHELTSATAIADLGSGAGLPGLAIAIALPAAEVVLIESNARKCEFIAQAIAACDVVNASVVNQRVESWDQGIGCFDVVTARALAPLEVVAEYAAPLLRAGGALVAWRGRRDPISERSAARAADELGLAVAEPVHVIPYRGAEHRHLHVMVKIADTPTRFPRRAGVARKRPLGSV